MSRVRVATVQYEQRPIESLEAFLGRVEHFVRVAADYRADFVVFPEIFTMQLLCFEKRRLAGAEAIARLTEHTPRLVAELERLARAHGVNIIGGSHFTRTEAGDVRNVAHVALRDGRVAMQEKIQPTPFEREFWGVTGGVKLDAIETDCGRIGVLICYDSEFPELARRLADQGARILFTPFCTDNRQGYLRVRYCCQARTIENQVYAVMSGNVGDLPNVEGFDVNYGRSCVLTPSDFAFARDGIAAETSENIEGIAVADLDMAALELARNAGTVRNLADRRLDLYGVTWRGE